MNKVYTEAKTDIVIIGAGAAGMMAAHFCAQNGKEVYLINPEAKYFSVGKITKDQVVDYSKRKELSEAVTKRWLSYIVTTAVHYST